MAFVPYGGHYVSWLFPNFGGRDVASAVGRAFDRIYPLFPRAVDAGHDTKVVVETFYHCKSMCKQCEALRWTAQEQENYAKHGSFGTVRFI